MTLLIVTPPLDLGTPDASPERHCAASLPPSPPTNASTGRATPVTSTRANCSGRSVQWPTWWTISISARSEEAGSGSEFIIRLPRMNPEQTGDTTMHEPSDRDRTHPPPGPRTILVADDNRDALESLGMLLELHGHEVYTAADGGEACRIAEQKRPQIALLDLGMPKLSGYDVARRIRRQAWGRTIYLVALTGWGQDGDRRRSAAAGFDTHLVKPLDPQVLLDFLVHAPAAPRSSASGV